MIKEDVRSYNIGEKVSNFADIIHEFFPGLWNVAAKGRRPNSSRRRRRTANMQLATISDTGRAQKIKSGWCTEKVMGTQIEFEIMMVMVSSPIKSRLLLSVERRGDDCAETKDRAIM